VSPAALSMVVLLFPDAGERTEALGIWGGLAALGGTLGVVVSGAINDLARADEAGSATSRVVRSTASIVRSR